MPKVVEITCDTCRHNLSTTGNSVDYRVALLNERVPSRGGLVTDRGAYPALEHDLYFCGMECLLKWAKIKIKKRSEHAHD